MERKAVAYLRVSGKGQTAGTGFNRQLESCQAAGFDIGKVYREAHTGTEAERPVFNAMIEDLLSNGVKVIVVESLDRLARDLAVQLQLTAYLAAKGLTLISATTGQDVTAAMLADPMQKAMVQIQGVFAELDKSLLVRKLRKARNALRKSQGRCEGQKPFGHYEGEAAVLKRLKQLNRKKPGEKRLGPYQIASQLNREGLKTRSGRPWHGVSVRQILERK